MTDNAAKTFVYKICPRSAWLQAQVDGELAPSCDDRRDGYIHLSTRTQLKGTLETHFRGQRDLVLLALPTRQLAATTLRWEVSRSGEVFPHLYGPLSLSLVTRVEPLEESGALPDDLSADEFSRK
jgi:uncharacterized protein (DUF952 family)